MQPKLIQVPFPRKGYNETVGFADQPQFTTPSCLNVRSFDPRTGRNRGAQRGGVSKHVATQVNSSNQVQLLTHIVTPNTGSPSSTSLNTRVITPVAIAGGTVKTFAGGTYSTPTNGSSAFSADAPVIYATPLFGVLYFADGLNYKHYTVSSDTVGSWTASAGTIPSHSTTNFPRLICTWRGRIVLAGIKTDASNWFMSKVGDATDWDYVPEVITSCRAVAANNSPAGLIPDDIVNTLIPFNDDVLYFGGDHSIYVMRGDPAEHGQLSRVSDITGMAWGRPWAKDPSNVLYFIGSRGGVYRMPPDSAPEPISDESVKEFFRDIDFSNTIVTANWNDEELGINFWFTNLDGSDSRHLFYDMRNKAFWLDSFSDAGLNPTSVHTLDGDDAGDRVVLLGCRSGHIRYLDRSASTDDGDEIESHVYLGPITGGPVTKLQATSFQFQMGENTDAAKYEVFSGSTSEDAFTNEQTRIGAALRAGRNTPNHKRASGHYSWIKLSNQGVDEHWSVENVVVGVVPLSDREQRRV